MLSFECLNAPHHQHRILRLRVQRWGIVVAVGAWFGASGGVAHAQAGLPYIEPEESSEASPPETGEPARPTEIEEEASEVEPAPSPPRVATRPDTLGLSPTQLRERWQARRQALLDGNREAAMQILDEIVRRKEDSGWPNAISLAFAVVSEALEALANNQGHQAVDLAVYARRLAPDEPRTHLCEARARWSETEIVGSVNALFRAARASWRNPWELRMRLANLWVGLALSALVAAVLFALASVYRHFRSVRFGVKKLLPQGATRAQAAILVLALLLAPILLGVGLLWITLVWSVASAVFYRVRERVAAGMVVVFLGVLPFILPWAFAPLSYTDSRAHDAFRAATDIGAEAAAARLAGLSKPQPSEQFVLGLRALWSGDIDLAAQWLYRAAETDTLTSELYVSLGNIEYARGRLADATRVYEFAIEQDPSNVMALFNLARLKFSQTEQQAAGELHRRANEIDYATVERWSEEAKRIGPTYVVRPGVPTEILSRGHTVAEASYRAADDVWRLLAGGVRPSTFAAAAAVALAFVVATAAIHRDDRKTRRGGPQPLERIRHEIEIHRHQARIARLQRIFAVIFAGAGQLLSGRSVLGLTFATGFIGSVLIALSSLELIPKLAPYDGGPRVFALLLAAALGFGCYGLSLWDNLRGDG